MFLRNDSELIQDYTAMRNSNHTGINLLQMKHPRPSANLKYNPIKAFCTTLPEIIAAYFFWLYSFARFYFLETAKK
jgi:hypothetical protein